MGPELVIEIYGYIQQIYEIAQEVKANKAQCKALATRVLQFQQQLQGLSKLPDDKCWWNGLLRLQALLEECITHISQFKKKNWARKVIFRGTYRETFQNLNAGLTQVGSDLMLGIVAQAAVDHSAEEEDRKELLAQQAAILEALKAQDAKAAGFMAQLQNHLKIQTDPKLENAEQEIIRRHAVKSSDIQQGELFSDTGRNKYYRATYLGAAVLLLKINHDAFNRKEFLREITVTARIESGSILQLVGACFEEGNECILFEAAEQTLLQRLSQKIEFIEACKWLREIAASLTALHKKEIYHGNLNFNTIMLVEGEAKLTGFTFAAIQATTVDALGEVACGASLDWCAPELKSGVCRQPTAACDVYSLGVLIKTIGIGISSSLQTLHQSCCSPPAEQRPTAESVLWQLNKIEHIEKQKKGKVLYAQAWDAEQRKDFVAAAKGYLEAAKLGYIKAITNLATFYRTGQGGLALDLVRAFALTKQAAEAGHARAMQNLVGHYRDGLGVTNDLAAAEQWLEKYKAAKLKESEKPAVQATYI